MLVFVGLEADALAGEGLDVLDEVLVDVIVAGLDEEPLEYGDDLVLLVGDMVLPQHLVELVLLLHQVDLIQVYVSIVVQLHHHLVELVDHLRYPPAVPPPLLLTALQGELLPEAVLFFLQHQRLDVLAEHGLGLLGYRVRVFLPLLQLAEHGLLVHLLVLPLHLQYVLLLDLPGEADLQWVPDGVVQVGLDLLVPVHLVLLAVDLGEFLVEEVVVHGGVEGVDLLLVGLITVQLLAVVEVVQRVVVSHVPVQLLYLHSSFHTSTI